MTPLFKKGDAVSHTRRSDGLVRTGEVIAVHTDDVQNGIYYTVSLPEGIELQSNESNLHKPVTEWTIDDGLLSKYSDIFDTVQENGLVCWDKAVDFFGLSGLDNTRIQALLFLSDVDKDGQFDRLEFSVGFHMAVGVAKKGKEMPTTLPDPLAVLFPYNLKHDADRCFEQTPGSVNVSVGLGTDIPDSLDGVAVQGNEEKENNSDDEKSEEVHPGQKSSNAVHDTVLEHIRQNRYNTVLAYFKSQGNIVHDVSPLMLLSDYLETEACEKILGRFNEISQQQKDLLQHVVDERINSTSCSESIITLLESAASFELQLFENAQFIIDLLDSSGKYYRNLDKWSKIMETVSKESNRASIFLRKIENIPEHDQRSRILPQKAFSDFISGISEMHKVCLLIEHSINRSLCLFAKNRNEKLEEAVESWKKSFRNFAAINSRLQMCDVDFNVPSLDENGGPFCTLTLYPLLSDPCYFAGDPYICPALNLWINLVDSTP